MSILIELKKTKNSSKSRIQKTFENLIKKIEKLQRKLEQVNHELDLSLQYYHENILPASKYVVEATTDIIKILYRFYQEKNKFSKRERTVIKSLFIGKIKDSMNSRFFPLPGSDLEMDTIMKEFKSEIIGEEEDCADEHPLEMMKGVMTEVLKEYGVDADFSNIHVGDEDHVIQQKIKDSIDQAQEKMDAKPKTKRQIEKEKKVLELAEAQKRGINGIYKQLAKHLHPDLEQDPLIKIQKEAFMKRLTAAYEANDLSTLLQLEIEWMERSNTPLNVSREGDLKIYISVLKDQVGSLEDDIYFAVLHPKYADIFNYVDDPNRIMENMYEVHEGLEKLQGFLDDGIQNLTGKNKEAYLRMVIEECS